MVLGNFHCWDALLIRIFIGQGPTVPAVGPSGGWLVG